MESLRVTDKRKARRRRTPGAGFEEQTARILDYLRARQKPTPWTEKDGSLLRSHYIRSSQVSQVTNTITSVKLDCERNVSLYNKIKQSEDICIDLEFSLRVQVEPNHVSKISDQQQMNMNIHAPEGSYQKVIVMHQKPVYKLPENIRRRRTLFYGSTQGITFAY